MTARDIAKAWRANPADRLRIEREIAVSGRQAEFRRDEAGNLIALRTDDDRQRSLGASASIRAFKSSSAGMREMPRGACFDGEPLSDDAADEFRQLGRRAA